MQTYIVDFDYSIHTIQRVTHQLKIVEEPIIDSNKSKLDVFIVRINSGKEADGGNEALKLTINGDVVLDTTYGTPSVPANSTQEVFIKSFYISHNSDGTGSLNISAVYKCDYIEGWGLDIFWWTIATAEFSGLLTPIDRSAPTVSDISISADRYGRNASVSFRVSHSSYELEEVEFKLKGLTKEQAKCRDLMYDNDPPADVNQNYNGSEDGSYYIRLIRDFPIPISQFYECYYPLDDGTDGMHPLESGKSYPYEIIATACNNKTTAVTGILKVPQKVTGITCESGIDLLPEQTTELVYNVIPQNAEEKAVEFRSSDNTVATVDSNGKITAIGEGMCQITVTTLDGGSLNATSGFSASCSVTVLDKNHFPKLKTIRYLSVREITNIVFACTFLHDKLIERGLSVPGLAEVVYKGRTHPVKEIRGLLETINSNCLILKNASSSVYPTENLSNQTKIIKQNTESNWYITVNEWIRFLNELNNLIEKEV